MSDNEKISPEKMRDLVVKIFLESGKSAEEFIADYEKWCRQKEKKEQLEARAKRQAALQSERERKKRNHLLFVLGGTIMKFLGKDFDKIDAADAALILENFLSEARTNGRNIQEYFIEKKGKA